jgi:hypothetical protein
MSILAARALPRHIGRANVLKLLAPWAPEPGTSVYRDGAACFTVAGETVRVRPPFGLAHTAEYDHVELAPLKEALYTTPLVGVLLVRLGGYAVGVYDGEQLLASKVGTRFVKGRHKKGGSSQSRFRRRREEQAKALVNEAAEVAERVFAPFNELTLALGGNREAARLTLAESTALAALPQLERFFEVEDPRQRILDRLSYDLYAAEVTRG